MPRHKGASDIYYDSAQQVRMMNLMLVCVHLETEEADKCFQLQAQIDNSFLGSYDINRKMFSFLFKLSIDLAYSDILQKH